MNHGPPGNQPNLYGNEPCQIVARDVFPKLIQVATNSERLPISYDKLAEKAGIPYYPSRGRNMAKPLGIIWKALFELHQDFDDDIPYLTTIVINKKTKDPTIFKTYLNWSDQDIADAQRDVYKFQRWAEIKEIIL